MSIATKHHLSLLAIALLAALAAGGVHLAGAAGGSATSVVPVEPYRILDTRLGTGAPPAPLGPGQTIDVQIAGVGPVPVDAVGVVLNVTGTRTSDATYITAWPTGTTQPTASVLNLTPGIDAPNGVTALLGTGGKLSLFNFTGTTDLIADVAGYLVLGGAGGGQGPTGLQGPTGPRGPAGPTGPQGASGMSGHERVTVALLAAPSPFSLTATCPGTKKVVGGGGGTAVSNWVLTQSLPISDNAWRVAFRYDSPGGVVPIVVANAYAICVNAT